ncbi:MAG: FAD:protein FMN transferase [Patulibacter sp.]|nr:FAD:protein FMN transferase [Patulibacter sp.]
MSAVPRTRSTSSAATTRARSTAPAPGERTRTLDRFGGRVELRVQAGPGRSAQAEHRLDRAVALLAEFDRRLSRFDASSELCRLNADPRDRVPASPMMQRFAEAVGWAGRRSDGLVDASVLPAVEAAGYVAHFDRAELDRVRLKDAARPWAPSTPSALTEHPAATLAGAPGTPVPAPEDRLADDGHELMDALGAALHALAGEQALLDAHAPAATWRDVRAGDGCVVRPAGLRLDSGGIGKGLAADLAAELLRGAPSWVVDCGGDLRIGGTAGQPRAVDITDPYDRSRVLHRLHVTRGGVATSGVTRRSWDQDGERRHHLIDPRTGRPADTGVLQVTALAPTALEAEVIAKTALLGGEAQAHTQLPHGGVIVCANGLVIVVPPPKVSQRPVRRPATRARFDVPGYGTLTRLVERPR